MTTAMKAEYFASCLLPLSPAEEWYNSLPNLSRANYEDVTKSFEVRFTTPEPDTHRTNTEIQMILKAENTFDESVDHASSGPSAQTATPIQAVAAIREVSDDPNGPKEYSTRAPATSANKVVPAEAASAPAALLLNYLLDRYSPVAEAITKVEDTSSGPINPLAYSCSGSAHSSDAASDFASSIDECEDQLERDEMEEYHARLREWESENRGKKVTENSAVPLTPNTSPAGAGECWWCGQNAAWCEDNGNEKHVYGQRCANKWVSPVERSYRQAVWHASRHPIVWDRPMPVFRGVRIVG